MSTDSQGDDSGGDGYVCGYDGTSSTDGPCQFPVSAEGERCHMHPRDGSGAPDGHGSGSPDHSMGDGAGEVEENVDDPKPALSHGVHAVQDDPRGLLEYLQEHRPEGYRWVVDKWRSYMVDAPFDRESAKADDVMEACLMKYAVRGARREQVETGLTKMVSAEDEDGNPLDFDVEEELPANLPANRIAREARSMLKDLGVLDDPESAKAKALEQGWGEAAREVAQEADDGERGDVVDVDFEEHDTPE